MTNEQPSHTQHHDDEISLTEIAAILWKYKLLIILLPIGLAVAAYIGSQFLTPSYSSTTKLYLGNYTSEMYTNTNSAEQVILSNDVLSTVMNANELKYDRAQDLRQTVSVETLNEEAKMLEITANHSDPKRAQEIADGVANQFVKQAQPAFEERQNIIEERYQSTEENYNQTSESLNRNEQALQGIEENQGTSEAETDLARARLIDYIEKDESKLLELEEQLHKQELKLNELKGPEVFEQAVLPQAPDSPSPMLNTAVAFVIGGMAGVGLAFVIEFFRNNPIRRRKA